MRPLLDALDERVLVCDGAMGTMLYASGVFVNRCFDELNLSQPDLVAEVHQRYVRAGADIIETNTFGANPIKLGTFGLAARVHAINVQGARIARHAARESVYVAGAIGPLGIRVEPWGRTGLDEAEEYFRAQAAALAEGGVDLFILETFRDVNELGAAIRAVRSASSRPIVAQLTTGEDGNTLDGTPPEVFAPELERAGVDVIGLNCAVGPATMLETVERMATVTSARLSAMPNAGKPRDVEGRNIYLCSPEYMASYARRFILSGVRLVGGCCGTTPEHVRAVRQAVRALAPTKAATSARAAAPVSLPRIEPVPRGEKSRLARALAAGEFVLTVELRPPRGDQCQQLLDAARALEAGGVHVVSVPDASEGGARISALAVAVLVERHTGLETILHCSSRDERLLSLQSELLGAHAMGLRNVMLVTGEPASAGDFYDATAAFDVDSIGLVNLVTRLNQGADLGGKPFGRPTAFHVGVAVNPGAISIDEEIRRYRFKVEAGAEFAMTPPVFDASEVERLRKVLGDSPLPLIVGIQPLSSFREAEYFANEVPGVRVPDRVLQRIRNAREALTEGVRLARELAAEVRPFCQGVRIVAPEDQVGVALDVLRGF